MTKRPEIEKYKTVSDVIYIQYFHETFCMMMFHGNIQIHFCYITRRRYGYTFPVMQSYPPASEQTPARQNLCIRFQPMRA